MKNIFALLFLFLLFGCINNPKSKKFSIPIKEEKVLLKNDTTKPIDEIILRETFIDSINIGIKGKYKVELNSFNNSDSTYVEITFSEKENKLWKQKQSFKLPKDGVISCEPKIKDFNNDKLNDFTFISAVAARGANEIRTLFIFDKKNKILKLIKNSSNYPNLQYNEVLNCIDTWLVYGGSSTVFFKIDRDSLREFAGVDLFENTREIYLIDENKKKKIIKNELIKDLETYTRFKNFNPLIENTNPE